MYLVRHAMTIVDPSTPSDRWQLSVDGRRAAAGLDVGIAVTHGLAISLFAGLDFDEWRAMPFPAVVEC